MIETLARPIESHVMSRTARRRRRRKPVDLEDMAPMAKEAAPLIAVSRRSARSDSGGPTGYHVIIDAAGLITGRAASTVLTGMGSRACF